MTLSGRSDDPRSGSDRRDPSSALVKVALNVVLAVALSIGAWAWTSTATRLLELERFTAAQAARVAVVETELSMERQANSDLRAQIQRVEDKLDRLLGRR